MLARGLRARNLKEIDTIQVRGHDQVILFSPIINYSCPKSQSFYLVPDLHSVFWGTVASSNDRLLRRAI